MKEQIENLINNAIDDFNSKWQSHEERNAGVSEYAKEIKKLKNDMEWISVEIRKPPLYTEVIVKDNDENYILAEIGGDKEDWYETRKPTAPYLVGITHWKPINN